MAPDWIYTPDDWDEFDEREHDEGAMQMQGDKDGKDKDTPDDDSTLTSGNDLSDVGSTTGETETEQQTPSHLSSLGSMPHLAEEGDGESASEDPSPDLKSAPAEQRADHEFVLAAVRQHGASLEFASEALRSNPEVVSAAVRQDSWALEFALGDGRKDRAIAVAAVRGQGQALEFVDEQLRADRGVVLEAVRNNGRALKWASEALRADREVVLVALGQDYRALEHTAEALCQEREVVSKAVEVAGERCRWYRSEDLWTEELLATPTVQSARELAWTLVACVEAREFSFALDTICPLLGEESDMAIDARLGLLYAHCFPTSPAMDTARDAFDSVKNFFWASPAIYEDIEVIGLLGRFEQSLRLEENFVLELDLGQKHGSKYPEIDGVIPLHVRGKGTWHYVDCDAAYPADGEALVVPPSTKPTGPAPVLLYLFGAGKFNSRESLVGSDFQYLFENPVIREEFYVVAPKPDRRSGLIYYTGVRWVTEWSEDAVWCLFTEILRRLGPEKVDPARLYVTGVSQGGVGAWGLAVKFGSMIAACQPMAGRCEWPGDSWPKYNSSPSPEAMDNLKICPIRHAHCSTDSHAPPPKQDMERVAYYEAEERSYDTAPYGWDMKTTMNTTVQKWIWKDSRVPFELFWVKGPMADNCPMWPGLDNHLVWFRVITNPLWGWANFFKEHTVPVERQWSFDSEPMKFDSSEHRAMLEEQGYFDKPESTPAEIKTETVDLGSVHNYSECEALEENVRDSLVDALGRVAQDHEVMVLLQISTPAKPMPEITELCHVKRHGDIYKAVCAFKEHLHLAIRSPSQGQTLEVSLQLSIPMPPQAVQFHVIAQRPWDKAALCKLRPGLPIFALKIRAAELIYMDAKKANTFEVGFRPSVKTWKKGQTIDALPIDVPLTEENLEFDVCMENKNAAASPQSLQADNASLKIMVLLKHHENFEVDGYCPTIHVVKRGTTVRELKKLVADINGQKLSEFGICFATSFPENDKAGEGVIKYELKDSAVLNDEHWLLQVCKPGLNISVEGKEMTIDKGTTIGWLKWILASGNTRKAKNYKLGIVPTRKGEVAKSLPDDTIVTERHAKLQLCF